MKDLAFTLDYLKATFPSYGEVRKNSPLFPCPICGRISCKIVPNTNYSLHCTNCRNIGNIFVIMKKLKNMEAHEVIADVKNKLNIDISCHDYEEATLSLYEKWGFDLVPISPREKYPIEKDWLNKEHKEKSEWKAWIDNENNIGVKTGRKSGITVIDVDTKEVPEALKPLLINALVQTTANGSHYFYLYEEELPTTRIDALKVDILNNNKQCLIEPSITDGFRREFVGEFTIKEMPTELKNFLKSKVSVPVKTISERLAENDNLMATMPTATFEIQEGNRHNLFMHLGGIFRKELNAQQTSFTLGLLNKYFCKPPLSRVEMGQVVNSLEKYIHFDEKEIALRIMQYMKIVEQSNAKEIKDALEIKKLLVDKALGFLVKEGYLLKRGTNFHIIKKAEWKENFPSLDNAVNFEMPYFYDAAVINWGDMILLGSKAKYGKTTIAMNILKSFVRQGIKPYYISLETGSRFIKTAGRLGLKEGDFFWDFQASPTKIELEPNGITIIDWLMIEDKAETDSIMKYFVEQLYKSNGVLIVFMQLKQDGSWFAPNMVHQFPALSARYLYDNENDGSTGTWKVDVMREAKSKGKTGDIPCVYDWENKELRRVAN